MKSNLKKKQDQNKITKPVVSEQGSVKEHLSKQCEIKLQNWESAINDLKNTSFSSFEDAVNAVIDKVVDSMNLSLESDEDMRELLWCMIETDSQLENSIKKLL